MQVVCIVEGHGELTAVPILLRRMAQWLSPTIDIDIPTPIRVKRNRFVGDDAEFQKYVELAGMKCGEGDLILILLDADDDCPAELGAQLSQKARLAVPHRPVSIVLAKRGSRLGSSVRQPRSMLAAA